MAQQDKQNMSNLVPISDNSLPSYETAILRSNPPEESIPEKADNWMPIPRASNCPPGLEYLAKIDKFLISQNNGYGDKINKYIIKNDSGQIVYSAVEGKTASDIKIFDYQKREVLHFHRSEYVNFTPNGTLCGSIKHSKRSKSPKLQIQDASGNIVLLIEGPSDRKYYGPKFKIFSTDGKTEVGNVSKLVGTELRRSHPDIEHFSISFPMDLDVNIKALLLVASILIDSLYYKINPKLKYSNSSDNQGNFHDSFQLGYCLGDFLASCLR